MTAETDRLMSLPFQQLILKIKPFPFSRNIKKSDENPITGLSSLLTSIILYSLPWHTKSIFVKCDQPPEKPYSAAVYRDLPGRKSC